MSVMLPVDHHATFAGCIRGKTSQKDDGAPWSSRRRLGFIVIAALASWILVLSPFVLLH